MKTKEQIRNWILENCVDPGGSIDLTDLDFDGYRVFTRGMIASEIYQHSHKANHIVQECHEAETIYQSEHETNEIYQSFHKANHIVQECHKAETIYQNEHKANKVYQHSHRSEEVVEGNHTKLKQKVTLELTQEQLKQIKKLLKEIYNAEI